MSETTKSKRKVILVWVVTIIILWESGAWMLQNIFHDAMALQKLPYFHNIIFTFSTNFGSLLNSGAVTLSRAFIGFLLGGTIGFAVAIIMSWTKFFEKLMFPYMILSQMLPVLALAPIVYTVVKNPDTARIVIAAFITFFPVAVNTFSGLKSIEKEKIELIYSYAASKFRTYQKLMIPASLPYLLAGLKLSAPRAITAAILVEMLGTDKGIGIKILYTLYYGVSGAHMFWASVLMAALLGVMSYAIVLSAEKLLTPWERTAIKMEGEH